MDVRLLEIKPPEVRPLNIRPRDDRDNQDNKDNKDNRDKCSGDCRIRRHCDRFGTIFNCKIKKQKRKKRKETEEGTKKKQKLNDGVRALASHQCGLGSNPGIEVIRASSLLLVLSFAPRG